MHIIKSEAIDTNQLLALMVAKMTLDIDWWKSITKISINTDNDHVSLYGDIKSFGACVTSCSTQLF